MKKSAIFWCEHCSKKCTIDDFENARQIDLSKIQKKIPFKTKYQTQKIPQKTKKKENKEQEKSSDKESNS